jgi:hypothetical protein
MVCRPASWSGIWLASMELRTIFHVSGCSLELLGDIICNLLLVSFYCDLTGLIIANCVSNRNFICSLLWIENECVDEDNIGASCPPTAMGPWCEIFFFLTAWCEIAWSISSLVTIQCQVLALDQTWQSYSFATTVFFFGKIHFPRVFLSRSFCCCCCCQYLVNGGQLGIHHI